MIASSRVLGGPDAPSNKLNIAGIGVGNQGRSNMMGCKGENIVALCDVDHKFAAGAFEDHPSAKRYKDYRVMFDEMKDIDAVVIATPDHTHASIAMAAMKQGIHVFCQKPLTHDISEARILAAAAKKYDVVSQMGIQGHAQEGIRLITEWINDGAIGEIREVDAWCSLMYSPPGHAYWSSILQDRPKEGQALPAGLDWDSWIGPAAMRPFHRCYHPSTWRCWWDFGCGMMGDRGAHTLDPVFSALKLGYPDSIEGSDIVGGNAEVHPDKAKVVFKFPAREGFPPLTINWYEGQEPPRPKELEEGRSLPSGGGTLFKGDKGIIRAGVYGNSPRLIPETAMKAYKRPEKTLPRIKGGIIPDWINAIKEGRAACADFSYSGPLTELALLGNLGKRFPGHELKWDGKAMKVTNHDEANAWVKRPRRKGWEI
ncbi:MAG: Gfo/Idh/MocA family oxidoreductase [Verrucomicrobiae bacterium]|nr:Gfo/Idh/MocA family oxidoreductase [Verrucomicrobiae bacterium]NNJ42876.1 Gfo/Idh/MocA family oxidoreductase [Akkermansiaceae bacterium]